MPDMDKFFLQNELPFASWLEEYRVPEELMVAAYEEIGPLWRGALKTAIALTTFVYGNRSLQEEKQYVSNHAGFWCRTTSKPATWALVIIAGNFQSAARLYASAILPILANVQHIYCIWENEVGYHLLLPALELCGLENIFCLQKIDILRLINNLLGQFPEKGRILLLHDGSLEEIAKQAIEYKICCYEDKAKPRLLVKNPELFNLELLEYAHGFAPDIIEYGTYDAAYASLEMDVQFNLFSNDIPLVLTPGLECFWLHKTLAPKFFMLETNNFGLL